MGESQQDSGGAMQISGVRNAVFVLSYAANFTIVTVNAMMFVFADWVHHLCSEPGAVWDYSEELPGRIVRYGLFAALFCRLFLGRSIDRFGVRVVWSCMTLMGISGLTVFLLTQTAGPIVFVGRILFAAGMSGMLTCGTFHIQTCVDDLRRTEFLALLGSSGFSGMICGSLAAARLKAVSMSGGVLVTDRFFSRLLIVVLVLNIVYFGIIQVLNHKAPARPSAAVRSGLLTMMRMYWPGWIVLIAMIMGLTFAVPSIYLARFNSQYGYDGLAVFWSVYAVAALVFRVTTARLSRRTGRYRMVALGTIFQGIGLCSFILVDSRWMHAAPAVLAGLGHALLFPSMVSLGSGTFPPQFRGSGTNLTLGFLDAGIALAAPLLGRMIDMSYFDGAGYRPTFLTAGLITLAAGTFWATLHWHTPDAESLSASLSSGKSKCDAAEPSRSD